MADAPHSSANRSGRPSALSGWFFAVLVVGVVIWLMRPQRPRFLRIPGGGLAPRWEFTELSGRRVGMAHFDGKIVVLNFWATWCSPCLRELPELAAFHLAHVPDGVTVIGVSIDDLPAKALESFLEKSPPPYPVLLADQAARDSFGGVSQIPETWVIQRDGRVAARYLGPINREELERTVAPLLGPR